MEDRLAMGSWRRYNAAVEALAVPAREVFRVLRQSRFAAPTLAILGLLLSFTLFLPFLHREIWIWIPAGLGLYASDLFSAVAARIPNRRHLLVTLSIPLLFSVYWPISEYLVDPGEHPRDLFTNEGNQRLKVPEKMWKLSLGTPPVVELENGLHVQPTSHKILGTPVTLYNPYEVPDDSGTQVFRAQLRRALRDCCGLNLSPAEFDELFVLSGTVRVFRLSELAEDVHRLPKPAEPWTKSSLSILIFLTALNVVGLRGWKTTERSKRNGHVILAIHMCLVCLVTLPWTNKFFVVAFADLTRWVESNQSPAIVAGLGAGTFLILRLAKLQNARSLAG